MKEIGTHIRNSYKDLTRVAANPSYNSSAGAVHDHIFVVSFRVLV